MLTGHRRMIVHNKICDIGIRILGKENYWKLYINYTWIKRIIDKLLFEFAWYIKSIPYRIERLVFGYKDRDVYTISYCPRLGFHSVTKVTPEGRKIVICTTRKPIEILP